MAEEKATPDEDIENLMSFLRDRDSKSALAVLDRIYDPNLLYSEEESGSFCVLYQAVRTNHPNIVEILLQKGANPNLLDEEGETPLFAAFDLEINEEIQTTLYKYGADANIKNKAGNTALMQIALRGMDYGHKCSDKTILNFLAMCKDFEQLNSRDQYLIHMIPFVHASLIKVERGDHICVQFLKVLTEHGVRVNVRDSTGWTPLHYACAACCFNAVTFLVENGADIHAKTSSQQTVLHSLGQNPSGRDFRVIFEYLIGKGVDINDKDMFGMDVLHYAASTNKVSKTSMEIILSHGGEANAKDKFGLTPLHLCVIPSVFIAKDHLEDDEDLKNDVSDLINVLVQNGGDINATDNNKLTPVHYALRYEKKVPSVSTLLKNGANLSKRTKTGESAVHRATLYPDLLNCVLGHIDKTNVSIDINLKDNFGSTPLHWAVYYMEPKCVTMLLKAGADLNIANGMGVTPCDLAISLKITDLFESLGIMYCRKTYPLPYTITENDFVSEEEMREEKIWSMFNALNKRLHEELGEEKNEKKMLMLDLPINENEYGKVQKEAGAEKLRELNGNSEDKGHTSENGVHCKAHKRHWLEVCIERKNTNTENSENPPKNEQGTAFMKQQYVCESDASEGDDLTMNWIETDDKSDIECSGTLPEDEHQKEEKLIMSDHPDSVQCTSSSLEGSVNTEKCTNVDHMWCDCPELSEVEYNDRSVNVITWLSHLSNHKRSLAAYMNHVLDSKQMGLVSETDENKYIADSIKNAMDTLALEVKRINPLFEFSLKLAGSWNEETKITQPDEFDYKLILHRFNAVVQPLESDDPGLKGFVQFRLKDGSYPMFMDFIDNDGHLDGRKVVRALYTSINTALLNIPPGTLKQLYITKYLKIEKGSIDHLSFRWVGPMYKNLLIDVDVVPTIVPDSWTCSLLNTHKRLILGRGPSPVVLKTQDSRFVKGWYSYFRFSVAEHEAEIFKRLPFEILKGYILVKSLMKTLHFPQIRVTEDEDCLRFPSLTTYMLKSAFLHQVEQSIGKVDPLGDKTMEHNHKLTAVTMARSILDYLVQSIDRCYLESFFIPGVNLLANDSLTRFNNKIMFDTEVACLEALLETGLNEMKYQGLV